MPFQSEKQRRYLHANHPEIAKRWERDYANGGVAALNTQLNSLPEYYMPFPAAHGGLIPAHQAGIYGLAEGGRTGFQYGSPHEEAAASYAGTHAGENAARDHGGGDGGYQNVHQTGAVTQTPGRTTTTTGDGRSQALINIANRPSRYKTVETHVPHTDEIVTTQIRDYYDPEGYQKRAPQDKPTITIGGMGVNLLTFALTGGIDNPLTRRAASKVVKWGADKIGLEKTINTFVGENFGSIDDMKKRIEERVAKEDLIQSLPRGHPERIQLEGLTKEIITPERDDRRMQDTSIKIEDIEGYNEKVRASTEANIILEDARNAKRDAYLAAFRQKYLMGPTAMAAGGGRVPGYNTGGLSNLFRLKNR